MWKINKILSFRYQFELTRWGKNLIFKSNERFGEFVPLRGSHLEGEKISRFKNRRLELGYVFGARLIASTNLGVKGNMCLESLVKIVDLPKKSCLVHP